MPQAGLVYMIVCDNGVGLGVIVVVGDGTTTVDWLLNRLPILTPITNAAKTARRLIIIKVFRGITYTWQLTLV